MRDQGTATLDRPRAVAAHDRWHARLALEFARVGPRTVLARREHVGPLVVQKPLYPEGESVCQCIVVHPPGGIAGGDRLELDVAANAGTHVQLTTPGAAKWYRSGGARAEQRILFRVGTGAVLEWLPQGTIVFDEADATSELGVHLEGDAAFIGWDVVCLGRTASSEQFTAGRWRQRVDVERDGALIWSERMVLTGNSPWLDSPAGLNGAPVFGTFVAVSATFDDSTLHACRALAPVQGDGAVTRLPGAFVARYRGPSSESAHGWFTALWRVVRPHVAGRAAVIPRIWHT